jgi:hypothetical protein
MGRELLEERVHCVLLLIRTCVLPYLCIATGYGLEGWGSIPDTDTASRPDLGLTQPSTQWVAGGVKPPGCEADYSLSSSAEVKNGGAIPSFLHTSS